MFARFAGVALLAFGLSASGQTLPKDLQCKEGMTPQACYIQLTDWGDLKCTTASMLGAHRAMDCATEVQNAVKPVFAQVREQLKGKPKAEELLKDHYAAWRAHLHRIPDGNSSESSARLKEKSQRLQIELE